MARSISKRATQSTVVEMVILNKPLMGGGRLSNSKTVQASEDVQILATWIGLIIKHAGQENIIPWQYVVQARVKEGSSFFAHNESIFG